MILSSSKWLGMLMGKDLQALRAERILTSMTSAEMSSHALCAALPDYFFFRGKNVPGSSHTISFRPQSVQRTLSTRATARHWNNGGTAHALQT